MEVFYSADHFFSFYALPSMWDLENMGYEHTRLAQFIRDFRAWMPLYPTRLAAGYIKNVRVSISISNSTTDCFGRFHMSENLLCVPLMRKSRTSGLARGACLINLVFYGNKVQLLGPSFFSSLQTLTAFNKISIRSSFPSDYVHQALNPSKPDLYLRNPWEAPLKSYTTERIVEELQPALGSAIVQTEGNTEIVEFNPRTYLSIL